MKGLSLKLEALVRAQHKMCAYCSTDFYDEDGRPLCKVTFDHVMPKSKGGSDNLTNGLAACEVCNTEKDDRLPNAYELAIHEAVLPLALEAYQQIRQERGIPDPKPAGTGKKARAKAARALRNSPEGRAARNEAMAAAKAAGWPHYMPAAPADYDQYAPRPTIQQLMREAAADPSSKGWPQYQGGVFRDLFSGKPDKGG